MTDRYRSGRYAQDNPDWHEPDARHKARAVARMVNQCGLHPSTIADVGCGSGRVLLALKARLDAAGRDTIHYEGWDIAPQAIKRARKNEGDRLHFVCDDFLGSERRVDVILCLDTFEHVADDVSFLSQLRSRADWFVFRIPLDMSALDAARPARMLHARRQWGHRHAYNRALAEEVLAEAGYDVEVAWYHRVPPEVSGPRGRVVDLSRRAFFRAAPDLTVRLLGGWSLMVCASPQDSS